MGTGKLNFGGIVQYWSKFSSGSTLFRYFSQSTKIVYKIMWIVARVTYIIKGVTKNDLYSLVIIAY